MDSFDIIIYAETQQKFGPQNHFHLRYEKLQYILRFILSCKFWLCLPSMKARRGRRAKSSWVSYMSFSCYVVSLVILHPGTIQVALIHRLLWTNANQLEESKREQKYIKANIRLGFFYYYVNNNFTTLRPISIAVPKPDLFILLEIHNYLEKINFSNPIRFIVPQNPTQRMLDFYRSTEI